MNHSPTGVRVFRDEDGRIESMGFCPRALKMQQLAYAFPTLGNIESIDPWDVHRLATESIHAVSSGTRLSVLFVLSVWDPETPEYPDLERFCVHDALRRWDDDHRAAFLSWASDPWWA